jgi:thiol-disulfide isomerase/thioredoxin
MDGTKKKRLRTWVVTIAAVCFAGWVSLVIYVNWAMHQRPEVFGHVMARMPMPAYFVLPFETLWTRARKGQLNVGEDAPGLTVKKLEDHSPTELASLWAEKPVVLVFGSYTWPPFRREVPALNKLAEQYRDKVGFYAVYILEAHPTDVWQMQSNVRDGVLFRSPQDEAERASVAGACVRKLGIKFPALIDSFDNRVESAYTGWPDRLYLIGQGGRILYKSKPGPFGFHPADLAQAIKTSVTAD